MTILANIQISWNMKNLMLLEIVFNPTMQYSVMSQRVIKFKQKI